MDCWLNFSPIKGRGRSLPNVLKYVVLVFMALCMPLNGYAQSDGDVSEQRPWQVCNETSYILNIAVASVTQGEGNSPLTVKGWHRLRSGKCQIMAVEQGTPRYVYARSASLHQGGVREWKGRRSFCVGVKEDDFTASTNTACNLQDKVFADFLRVVPTEERTAFVEPANYGKKAETAGLQRLLMDNNYAITRVDGLGGRRTSNTLDTFLKDHKLSTNSSLGARLDALEKFATAAQSTIGLTICSTASARIWSAIAYRADGYWESKGWWPIEPNSCVRPLARNLKNMEAHVYARLEVTGQQDRILIVPQLPARNAKKVSNKEFCISEAGFAAITHEFCEDQGYVSAQFKPVSNIQTGVTLSLSDAEFKQTTLAGLR